jgi:hypothetical protein
MKASFRLPSKHCWMLGRVNRCDSVADGAITIADGLATAPPSASAAGKPSIEVVRFGDHRRWKGALSLRWLMAKTPKPDDDVTLTAEENVILFVRSHDEFQKR